MVRLKLLETLGAASLAFAFACSSNQTPSNTNEDSSEESSESSSSGETTTEGDDHDHGEDEVPDEFKDATNPNELDDEDAIKAGRVLYEDNCASCHGDDGKGDGPEAGDLKEAPPSLVSHEASEWKDNFFFYRVTVGEPEHDMPSFAETLSDEERWQVITYLRELQAAAHDDGNDTESGEDSTSAEDSGDTSTSDDHTHDDGSTSDDSASEGSTSDTTGTTSSTTDEESSGEGSSEETSSTSTHTHF